jgi:hypothetical protein
MLKNFMRKIFPDRRGEIAKLEAQKLKSLVRMIVTTRPDEIGCDECFEQLDRFVEMELAGKNAAAAMPLVQDHLNRCRECQEEFQALLVALRAMA